MKNIFKYCHLFLMILVLFIIPKISMSQECGEYTLNDAKKKYETGNFGEVFRLLQTCLESGFKEDQKVQAYRLISMTYLALDSMSSAKEAASQLLDINSNFVPSLFDPPKFVQMINELKLLESSKLVTSVSKKAENLFEAPATVTVITEEEIRNRGYQDLEQVLHDVPGFNISKGSGPAYSLFYQRGYRSVANDRFLLLVDGVEENDLNSDNVCLYRQYSLSNIKRIEVVYGPASTMYGANAFIGVINVITKDGEELVKQGKTMMAKVQANYGSYNTRYVEGSLAAKGRNISFSLTGRLIQSDERDLSAYPEWDFNPRSADYYRNIMNISGMNSSGGYLAQDYLNSTKLDSLFPGNPLYNIQYNTDTIATAISLTDAGLKKVISLDSTLLNSEINGKPIGYNNQFNNWMINGKLKVKDFTFGIQSWRTNQGALPWYTTNSRLSTEDNSRWITWNSFFYIGYNKEINDKLLFTNLTSYRLHAIDGNTNFALVSSYYNGKYKIVDLVKDKEPSVFINYYYRVSNQIRNETRLLYVPSIKLNILSGIEFRNSIIQANYLTDTIAHPDETANASSTIPGGNNFRTLDMGIFSQLSYNITHNLNFVFGARVDNNKIRQEGGYGFVFNPRLAIVYHPGKFVFKVIYAEAFKDASFLTKYATSPGRDKTNPGLTPERVKNIEFSTYCEATKQLSADLAVFYSMYSDVVGLAEVTLENGTKTTQFQPIGEQTIYGVQGNVRYRIENYTLWGNYSYTNPIDNEVDLRISDIASHMFNFGVNALFFKHLNLNLRTNYVGKRLTGEGTSGSNNPITEFDPYMIFHSTIAYNEILKGLTIQFSVNNILDKEYFDPGVRSAEGSTYSSRFPQNTRNFMIRVLYDL